MWLLEYMHVYIVIYTPARAYVNSRLMTSEPLMTAGQLGESVVKLCESVVNPASFTPVSLLKNSRFTTDSALNVA